MRASLIIVALVALDACGFRAVPLDDACFEYVVASDSHTCARKTDGTLWCWGDNQYGQLGLGDTEARSTPTWVEALGTDVGRIFLPVGTGDVSSRTAFTCATKRDKSLWCWGNNDYGQLGLGDTETRLTPVRVDPASLPEAHQASLGSGFACARKADFSIWCWGANESGQLGLGDTDPRSKPVLVGEDVRFLSTGATHACAQKTELGTLYCWGSNQFGQLGTGDTEPRSSPVLAGEEQFAEGTTLIITGGQHTCAQLAADSSLWCWGANQYGQLGNGDNEPLSTPTQVMISDLAVSFKTLAAGGSHTCAGKTDGSAWCWGSNRDGQLGDGSRDNRSRPVQVVTDQLGSGVDLLYAGGNHTCAKANDGALYCWGNNEYGQLGIEAERQVAVPTRVSPSCLIK